MKIGIFGGTFNPPHNTHVAMAQAAKNGLGLDRLIVVPCGIPPHKETDVDAQTRLALTRLAFDGIAEIWDFEIFKEGKSYTVDTLREVARRFPQAEIFLLIGGDSFKNFDKWHCPREIASLCTLAVVCRGRKTSKTTCLRIQRQTGAKFVFLESAPNNVSSSEIRLRFQFGMPVSDVPTAVNNYILQNNLYAEFRPLAEKLRGYLTGKRFSHSFYVAKRGLELADFDERKKVLLACMLHDCAKYIPSEKYGYYGFVKPDDMPEPVVHSFLGAFVAQKDFGVTDEEILNAIRYHTTGRPAMTRLEKIVYIADKTEETRPYPVSHLLSGSLDCQFKKCLFEANMYAKDSHGSALYPLSQQTMDFYFGKSKK